MPQQPELTSPSSPASPAPLPRDPTRPVFAAQPPPGGHPPERIPPWLQRAELFLRVLLRMYVGLVVCWLPWWQAVWDRNPFFVQNPALGDFATQGAVRGIITGIGLLNLWIAFQNAIHYRDR